MSPEMVAALNAGRSFVSGIVELDLPSGTRRLMVGAGEVIWGANTFLGHDPSIGTLTAGEEIREDAQGQAPNTQITITIASGANRQDIAGPAVQISPAKIWLASFKLDASRHLVVIPDPEPVFDGFVDQPTINLDRNRDELDYSLISGMDYFFEDTEGQRLSSEFHRELYPGEAGLDNVTGVAKKIYWATNAPPGISTGSSSIGGGGGGGGGDGRFSARTALV